MTKGWGNPFCGLVLAAIVLIAAFVVAADASHAHEGRRSIDAIAVIVCHPKRVRALAEQAGDHAGPALTRPLPKGSHGTRSETHSDTRSA